MARTVFFSWQVDTVSAVGRNLIERALDRAIARIGEDAELQEAERDLVVDKDTQGVAGSPPIVDTIFGKIDKAAVFVPDLTFVGKRLDERPTPNPNVLIEYGWALKSLGYGRMVTVMNTAFGEPTSESLPFDMRHLRFPITFNCPVDADSATRKAVRDELSIKLETALRAVLSSEDFLATLPSPALPPPFAARSSSADSPGRFKSKGEPIGIAERSFDKTRVIKLSSKPVIWLRVMPLNALGKQWTVEEIREKAVGGTVLRPISRGWMGLSFMRAPDGFGVFPALDENAEEVPAVVMAFNSGEVWGVDACLLDRTSSPNSNSIPLNEADFAESLEEYSGLLVRLGIEPPFRWIAGMEDLKGRGIFVPPPPGHISLNNGPRGHSLEDVVVVDGRYMPGENAVKALKPFFDRLHEVCCVSRPPFLDGI